jgi:hypothetical protein
MNGARPALLHRSYSKGPHFTIRRIRVCNPAPNFGHTALLIWAPRNLDFPHFGWCILPKSASQHAVVMIAKCCPQTWEHVGVMAGAVYMLDVGGNGAGKPQLGRLKNPNFVVQCPIEAK